MFYQIEKFSIKLKNKHVTLLFILSLGKNYKVNKNINVLF